MILILSLSNIIFHLNNDVISISITKPALEVNN